MNKFHNTPEKCKKAINIIPKKEINNKCKFCNKELSNTQSRWRHEQSCKVKDSEIYEIKKNFLIIKEESLNLKEELIKQKEEIIKLKKKNIDQTNNINNGTINNNNNNNTYNIVQFGTESLNDILTDPQKISVLENPNPSIKLVELVYTDDELKNYRNVRIPNLSNDKGQVYSEKDNRFKTKSKNFIMDKYGWNRRSDIEEMLNYIQENNIKLKNTNEIEHLINTKYNNAEYIKKNNKDILNTLYDYCYKLDEIYNYLNKHITK